MNKYLSLYETAKRLGIALNTLKYRIKKGKIPKKQLKVVEKKQVLVSIKYLDWLKENDTKGKSIKSS